MLENFLNEFKRRWQEKHYIECIGVASLILTIIIVIAVVIYLLLDFLLDVILAHYQEIAIFIAVFICAIYYIRESFAEKRRQREEEREEQRKLQQEADQNILERNYRLLRTCLFTTIRDMADVLGVKRPARETEINAPVHSVRKLNFVLYQYLVYRTSETKDAETIKSILRQEISRRLEVQEFAGISQSFVLVDGIAEAVVNVYSVEDNGAYLTISVAIADENYCRHIRQKASLQLLNQAQQLSGTVDDDF